MAIEIDVSTNKNIKNPKIDKNRRFFLIPSKYHFVCGFLLLNKKKSNIKTWFFHTS